MEPSEPSGTVRIREVLQNSPKGGGPEAHSNPGEAPKLSERGRVRRTHQGCKTNQGGLQRVQEFGLFLPDLSLFRIAAGSRL